MSRALPARPNLDHLRKEAKAVLKAHRSGSTSACEVLRHLSRFRNRSDEEILLSPVTLLAVQQALAVAYGFESWARLRSQVGGPAGSNDLGMRRYVNRQWGFALSIPMDWIPAPPRSDSGGGANEVVTLLDRWDDRHHLRVLRKPHDPKLSLEELASFVQETWVKEGFVYVDRSETRIALLPAIRLDFDLTDEDGTVRIRLYAVVSGRIRFELAFVTPEENRMSELYDRMARSFEFTVEPPGLGMRRHESREWGVAFDMPGDWNAFKPETENTGTIALRFSSQEDGSHHFFVMRGFHDPEQPIAERLDDSQVRGPVSEARIASRPARVFDSEAADGDIIWQRRFFVITDGAITHTLLFQTTDKSGRKDLADRIASSFEMLPEPGGVPARSYENTEWNFSLETPVGWCALPPIHTRMDRQIIRFECREDGYHSFSVSLSLLFDFRRSVEDAFEYIRAVLEEEGRGNIAFSEMTIASEPSLVVDSDFPMGDETLNSRHYHVPGSAFGYTLEARTTNGTTGLEELDRIARSFQFLSEPVL